MFRCGICNRIHRWFENFTINARRTKIEQLYMWQAPAFWYLQSRCANPATAMDPSLEGVLLNYDRGNGSGKLSAGTVEALEQFLNDHPEYRRR
jgi:hypothetical protein